MITCNASIMTPFIANGELLGNFHMIQSYQGIPVDKEIDKSIVDLNGGKYLEYYREKLSKLSREEIEFLIKECMSSINQGMINNKYFLMKNF